MKLKKIALWSLGTTILTSIITTLFTSPVYAGCSLNEKESQLKEQYNGLVSISRGQYNSLQAIPIAVDIYLTGGTISQEWAKEELQDIGIDPARFLVSNGFNPARDKLIGHVLTFQCWANFNRAHTSYNVSKPLLANEQLTQNPQPFMPATGTVQDLQGVESRDISERPWGMGGAYSDNTEANTTYESQGSPWTAKAQALNRTLEKSDTMLGDIQRTTRRFPFVDF